MTENIKNILTSIFLCALILFGIKIPTLCFFVIFVILGIVGFKVHYFARLFLFGNVLYALFFVFYAPTISLATALFPNIQPKPVATLFLTTLLSILSGILLHAPKEGGHRLSSKHLIISVILIWLGCMLINKSVYDPWTMASVLLAMSFSFITLFSKMGIYDYKPYHLKYALIIFLLLPIINFLPLEKTPRNVGIIKNHSIWANDEVAYDRKDWTLKANYSYSVFMKALSNNYNIIRLDEENDLEEKTAACDAILIITPTIPFSHDAKNLIREYVYKGGKLVIIGDHTDLYGHARGTNDILSGWGVALNYDAVFSPRDWFEKVHLRNMIVDDVRPMTGASIALSRPSYVMGWFNNWVSENANYNAPNFFGDLTWTGDDWFSDFPISSTSKIGKGTLTLWTDSTIFSNFALFQPHVLKTITYLIEKGGILSRLSFYYPVFTCLFILGLLIISKRHWSHLVIGFFIISALTGGTHLIYNIEYKGLYVPNKRVNVFCQANVIREVTGKQDLNKTAVSNLYSNLSRFDLFPDWLGEEPSPCNAGEVCVWFTTFDKFRIWKGYRPEFIVILDDTNELASLGFTKKSMAQEKNVILIPENASNRSVWVTSNNSYTKVIGSSQIFVAANVVDDNVLGDWWTNIDVSPYRKEMIRRFSDWLKYKKEISAYEYPKPGIHDGVKTIRMDLTGGEFLRLKKIDMVPITYDKQKYVYLGGELWGIVSIKDNETSVMGGPETSDNFQKYKKKRFVFSVE